MIILKEKNNKLNELKQNRMQKEEYAYDFVPELSHILNIDEQRITSYDLRKSTRYQARKEFVTDSSLKK